MFTVYIFIIIVLAPLFHLLFYSHDIFGYSRFIVLVYIAGLVIGFTLWKPLVLITLVISWSFVIGSWLWLVWNLIRGK